MVFYYELHFTKRGISARRNGYKTIYLAEDRLTKIGPKQEIVYDKRKPLESQVQSFHLREGRFEVRENGLIANAFRPLQRSENRKILPFQFYHIASLDDKVLRGNRAEIINIEDLREDAEALLRTLPLREIPPREI